MNAVEQIQLFRCRFLVFSVATRRHPATPRVQVEPIEAPETGEVCVCRAWIRGITDERVDVRHERGILPKCRHQPNQDRCCNHKVAIVVVMVVVTCVAEVCGVTTTVAVPFPAGDAAPDLIVVAPHGRVATISGARADVEAAESLGQDVRADLCLREINAVELFDEQANCADFLEALAAEVEAALEHGRSPVFVLEEPAQGTQGFCLQGGLTISCGLPRRQKAQCIGLLNVHAQRPRVPEDAGHHTLGWR
mmetsp:Transcript_85883/g.277337  ORF Transcript_85883/g.277337 Transcript_85883/m.277337 type:complete len:250 (-) Transcript_85883:362-1111(-)